MIPTYALIYAGFLFFGISEVPSLVPKWHIKATVFVMLLYMIITGFIFANKKIMNVYSNKKIALLCIISNAGIITYYVIARNLYNQILPHLSQMHYYKVQSFFVGLVFANLFFTFSFYETKFKKLYRFLMPLILIFLYFLIYCNVLRKYHMTPIIKL